MSTIIFSVNHLFLTKRTMFSFVCLLLFAAGSFAQGTGTYHIVSTTGTVIDKNSGKQLQVGDVVDFHTELQFGSLNDRCVLLNADKARYFLELPKSASVNSQLTVMSDMALVPVKSRPALITGTRGVR